MTLFFPAAALGFSRTGGPALAGESMHFSATRALAWCSVASSSAVGIDRLQHPGVDLLDAAFGVQSFCGRC